jgi:serine/threonine protein kinase
VIRAFGAVTQDDVDNEVRALKKLCQNQHPNIVQVFAYGELNPDSAVHFIDMELCDISLGNYLDGQELKNGVSWATVKEDEDVPAHGYNILQQILNGLLYIHCEGEVHRDLSPHNGTAWHSFI